VMRADIIAHEMNRVDVVVNLRIQLFQKGDEFLLTLAGVTLPKDCSRTSVECRKQIQGPAALVFMLIAARNVPELSGPRGRETRARLQGGFLIN